MYVYETIKNIFIFNEGKTIKTTFFDFLEVTISSSSLTASRKRKTKTKQKCKMINSMFISVSAIIFIAQWCTNAIQLILTPKVIPFVA